MKRAIVDGFFPELKGKFINRSARATGGSSKVAIGRAMAALLKEVKGKRVSVIKATITLVDVVCCDICEHEICRCGENELPEGGI